MNKTKIAAAGLALAAGIVMYFEGYKPAAYLDPIGIPTVCYGHTKNVKMGDVHSKDECRALLNADLQKAWDACGRVIKIDMLPHQHAACASFTYNVGAGNMERSTYARLMNAGKIHEACNELLRWNKAGGRVLPGLVKRRELERKVCLGE